ncbi:MAG: response regulator [Chitinophagaceae bacterium]
MKILIAEHDPIDVELLHNELQKSGVDYVSQVVKNETEYVNALTTFIPDLILADYTFPSFDGPTAFKIRNELAPETPFIFVSGTIGEEQSIELIKTGVTDYALKEYLFTLNHKIARALEESRVRRQKTKTEQALMESEKRLARAQQVALMGNWEFDFATSNLCWSDETFRICGIPPNQNSQSLDQVLSLIHPDDVDSVMQKVKDFQNCMCDYSITFRIIGSNLSVQHIFLDSKLVFDLEGTAKGLHGIVQDVTKMVILENKLAEERLARQKEVTAAVLTAQETERANIGNELNENLNQLLATAKMYVQLSGKKEAKRQIYLDMSGNLIQEVMVAIKKISKTLIIPEIHIISLVDNIKNLIHDLSLLHPLLIEFHKNGIPDASLDEKLQLTIYRIVQEQINNILIHSNATKAEINLHRQDNEIMLIISDNGDGCDVLKEKNGVGIINIRTRAELYDGRVDIISAPGKGYELRIGLHLSTQTQAFKRTPVKSTTNFIRI